MDEWLDLSELIDQVQEYLDIGLYEEAKELLARYESIYSDAWEIYFLRSRLFSEQDRYEEALIYLRKALRFDPDNPDILVALFYAFTQLNRMKRGARYLLRAERLFPENDLVLSACIWYYTEINEYDKAINCFLRGSGVLEGNPEAFRNASIAYERMGDFPHAQQCLVKALEISPHFDEARDLLADHYILQGEPEKSVTLYQEHLDRSPRNIRTLSRLVFSLSQCNKHAEAEKVAQEMISAYPNSPVGYVDLAYVHLNNRKPDLAITMADRALDVSPIDAEALRVKGIAYAEKRESARANTAFETALALDPHNPEIMRDYYHHLRNIGEFSRMKELVRRVIEQESPYCVEDYWFLAEHHRETGRSLDAFHNLHKAYKSMPGEKELIPPMVDILLDRGHMRYALPFLKRYVDAKGWNSVMNRYAHHRRLRGRRVQEGLRFLRFYGQKSVEFRDFVFSQYFARYMLLSALVLFATILVALGLFFGLPAALSALAGSLIGLAVWAGMARLVRRRWSKQQRKRDDEGKEA